METKDAPHDALITELIDLGDLKVWSVLITIFGDLAPGASDHIPGPILTTLMLRMGIKPEALRVALHRLKKDGWIETSKSGRVSHYKLTAHGRQETKAAHPRVFGPFPKPLKDWFLVISGDLSPHQAPDAGLPIGRGLFLTHKRPIFEEGLIVSQISPQHLPNWARDKICPSAINDGYSDLAVILTNPAFQTAPTDILEGLTLRLLVVHAWRRLILRHDMRILDLMGPDWPGSHCRLRILDILKTIPRQDLTRLTL